MLILKILSDGREKSKLIIPVRLTYIYWSKVVQQPRKTLCRTQALFYAMQNRVFFHY